MRPVTLLVVGAGDRGATYARLAGRVSTTARVVAVAEPRGQLRDRLGDEHGVPPERLFESWQEAAAAGRIADAAIVATPDHLHTAPALALLDEGYHLLLEKPMAQSPSECRAIAEAALRAGTVFGVGHVLRYTDYTRRLKALVDEGAVGELMGATRLEPIGYFHYAHSYVRGNWRREDESSFALLTKCCHDLDWLRFVLGRRPRRVASFGALRHFRAESRPAGAADRCLDCGVEASCPYSARRIYLGRVERGELGWPVSVLTPEPTAQSVTEALRDGPYGRCVYASDNDVVDSQVVQLELEGGLLASFVMTAFTPMSQRRTTIFGSRGQLRGDGRYIERFDFLAERTERIDTLAADGADLGGHGGGDGRLLARFLEAVARRDPRHVLSGPAEALESHLLVFAAERARLEGRVIDFDDYCAEQGTA